MTVTADDLDTSVALVAEALRPHTGKDWSVPAGSLTWTCQHTLEHTGSCLVAYAGQLIARPADRYTSMDVVVDEGTDPAGVLEVFEIGGRILSLTVRASPPATRAFHPYGTSDPAGFAGMGCVETLIHGYDVSLGLGCEFRPPLDLCARVLGRMFPDVPSELTGTDAWTALLWATGRTALPGHPRRERWKWHGEPLPAAPASP